MIGQVDSVIEEIYKRIKHIVDEVYRKKGLKSDDIRKYFLIRKNFKMILHLMGDLRHVYDEQKYPLTFDNRVYDILFFRVLMDRIYFEKDNPKEEDDQDQSFLENYNTFINELKSGPKRKLPIKIPTKMIDIEEIEKEDISNITTRELKKIIADCEHKATIIGGVMAKKFKDMAKKYQNESDKREKDLHDKIIKHIDKDGKWII